MKNFRTAIAAAAIAALPAHPGRAATPRSAVSVVDGVPRLFVDGSALAAGAVSVYSLPDMGVGVKGRNEVPRYGSPRWDRNMAALLDRAYSSACGEPPPLPRGRCGDGVCGDFERSTGRCPADCPGVSDRDEAKENAAPAGRVFLIPPPAQDTCCSPEPSVQTSLPNSSMVYPDWSLATFCPFLYRSP